MQIIVKKAVIVSCVFLIAVPTFACNSIIHYLSISSVLKQLGISIVIATLFFYQKEIRTFTWNHLKAWLKKRHS